MEIGLLSHAALLSEGTNLPAAVHAHMGFCSDTSNEHVALLSPLLLHAFNSASLHVSFPFEDGEKQVDKRIELSDKW